MYETHDTAFSHYIARGKELGKEKDRERETYRTTKTFFVIYTEKTRYTHIYVSNLLNKTNKKNRNYIF